MSKGHLVTDRHGHRYIVVDQLGDLDDHDRLYAYCQAERCGHNAELDIDALIERLGSGFKLAKLRRVLRCTKCGGRRVGIRQAYSLTPRSVLALRSTGPEA